ncbi:PREDICTED: uncharacterized protein LOC108967208 isoform X2 [Bactrocera latifrons]|nr:PREDICTED: uncharacterized protein LOC108967208 isoform X2 [Bactrocera latifrons]
MVDIENIEPIYEDCDTEWQSNLLIIDTSSSDSSNHSSSSDTGNTIKKTAVSMMEELRVDFLKATQTWKEDDEKE